MPNLECLFYDIRRNCKQRNTAQCNDLCSKYLLYDAIRKQSHIPPRFQKCFPWNYPESDALAYKRMRKLSDSIVDIVDNGHGLYLWSEQVGTGKTTLAATLANAYMEMKWPESYLEPLVVYVVIPDLLDRIKRSWDAPDNDLSDLLYNLEHCPLVIWDDIGSEKPSDWVRERLYSLINTRYTNELSNIFTSNLSISDLERRLGKRISSRIYEMCTVIEMGNKDFRREA